MTSALDMPEIMSYIYSKSWKLQFSASSSIIIIEDYYLQTFLHSLFIYEGKEYKAVSNYYVLTPFHRKEDLYANVFIEQNNPTKYSIELFQESR